MSNTWNMSAALEHACDRPLHSSCRNPEGSPDTLWLPDADVALWLPSLWLLGRSESGMLAASMLGLPQVIRKPFLAV